MRQRNREGMNWGDRGERGHSEPSEKEPKNGKCTLFSLDHSITLERRLRFA